jgi:hypothetical protein
VVYGHPFRTLGRRSRSRHRRVRGDARGHTCDSHRHDTASRFKREQRLFSSLQFASIEGFCWRATLRRSEDSRASVHRMWCGVPRRVSMKGSNQVTIVVRQLMNQPGSSAGAIRVGIAFRSSTDLCGCVPHERAMCETSMKC